MSTSKIYIYAKCSTCRNALQWLDAQGIAYESLPIRETPPSEAELAAVLGHYGGNRKRIINTSSKDYRETGLKDRLDSLSDSELFAELRGLGNLVKRPFVVGKGIHLAGFKEAEWAEAFAQG